MRNSPKNSKLESSRAPENGSSLAPDSTFTPVYRVYCCSDEGAWPT